MYRIEQMLALFLSTRPPVTLAAVDDAGRRIAPLGMHEILEQQLSVSRPTKQAAMVMLCTMCVIVICFNLFTMVLAEEKFSRVLLKQLLSPARSAEVVGAKCVFFLVLNLAAAAAITALYSPGPLALPGYWITLACASLGYMALGLLIVSFAGRQNTASLLTTGYLFAVGITVFLSREFALFERIRSFLPERYVFELLTQTFSDQPFAFESPLFMRYALTVLALAGISMLLVSRRGLRGV